MDHCQKYPIKAITPIEKDRMYEFNVSFRSFIKSKNSVGVGTEPRGTPHTKYSGAKKKHFGVHIIPSYQLNDHGDQLQKSQSIYQQYLLHQATDLSQ